MKALAWEEKDEADLLAALRQGDAGAYEQLVRRHAGGLLAAARRILGNEEDARDAVQDAFLSAHKGLANFNGASSLGAWLHRIAVNAALMRLRNRHRKHEQSIEALLPRFLDDGHQVDPPAPWSENVEQLLQQKETREQVRRSIDQLPETYRTVLLLRDIEELNTEETAQALGVTVSIVKTRLHRARQALRELLAPHFRGESA